jgi:hypothetical protein
MHPNVRDFIAEDVLSLKGFGVRRHLCPCLTSLPKCDQGCRALS